VRERIKMSTKMKFRHLKPDQITVPDVRVTSIWSDEEYGDFAATIETDGIQQALKCVKEGETFWLIDGLHRLDEAKRLGIAKIPVVYKEGQLVDALVENLTSNRLRGKTPASDEIKLIRYLQSEFNLEPWQIAERTGLSRDRIEQRIQIGTAAPEVLSCLEFDQISLGVAFNLSRLPNQGGQIALLARIMQATPPLTVKNVASIIDHALEIQADLAKPQPKSEVQIPVKTIACHLCGERYEAVDVYGLNACKTCGGLCRDYIQQLRKRRTEKVSPEDVLAREVAGEQDIDKARESLDAVRERP